MPSITDRLRLLIEWSPVLNIATKIGNTTNDHDFALAIAELAAFLSEKTHVKYDDELVGHLTAILKSEEGRALVEWARQVWDGLEFMQEPPPEEMIRHG